MNSAKKRIVIAITLAESGGAQTFVVGFAQWLIRHDYDVTVLAGEGSWLEERCREHAIPFQRIPFLGREIQPMRDVQAFFALRKILKELKPDAIHLNSTKMGMIGSLAARQANVPRIVYRIGGWTFLESLSPVKKWIYLHAEKWSASLKDVIVCVHPGDEIVAKKEGIKPREHVTTIANGIDLTKADGQRKTREEARQSLGLEAGTFVFGTIANFYPAKDLPRYMDACALVVQAEPRANFCLIGDGMERPQIEEAIRRNHLEQHVRLAGERNVGPTFLAAFDAFVLPSSKEGMPWSLLEAMSTSLPCVVTDVGANAWMLEGHRGGWIVPKQDPSALAQAMLEAMRKPDEAHAKGKAARQIVESRFPLEQTFLLNERACFPCASA